MNYADNELKFVKRCDVQKQFIIIEIIKNFIQGQMDLESILEDMNGNDKSITIYLSL